MWLRMLLLRLAKMSVKLIEHLEQLEPFGHGAFVPGTEALDVILIEMLNDDFGCDTWQLLRTFSQHVWLLRHLRLELWAACVLDVVSCSNKSAAELVNNISLRYHWSCTQATSRLFPQRRSGLFLVSWTVVAQI